MKNLYCLCVLAILFSCKKEAKTEKNPPVTNTPSETPLLAQADTKSTFNTDNLPLQTFTIDADKKTSVRGKNGTRLDIPANAFVDANGQPTKGKITVGLKEALDMNDIVMGGLVTMSGNKVLESGGMIYVNATSSEGKELSLAKTRTIQVTVPANKVVPGMMLFSGAEGENSAIDWTTPKDKITNSRPVMLKTSSVPALNEDYFDGDANIVTQLVAPLKPVEYKKSDGVTINLVFPHSESFPEFSYFKNVKWKLTDPSKYKKDVDGIPWEHVALAGTKADGVYMLTFSAEGRDNVAYEVIPVFEGQDFKKAMGEYEKAVARYEKEKKEKEERERLAREKYEREQKQLEKAETARSFAENYIFSIDKMGWVNCDRFYNDPQASDVYAEVILPGNNERGMAFAYMVFKERKICLRGRAGEKGIFTFGNNDGNMVRLPLGEQVTFIVVSSANEDPAFAMQDAVISPKMSVTLQPQELSKEKMKAMLDKELHQ